MPKPPLHGRIYHRLQLDTKKADNEVPVLCRKRQRTSQDLSTESLVVVASSGDNYHRDNAMLSCGMIFVTTNDSPLEYLLSLPKDLCRLACEAAVHQYPVVIRMYAVIPLNCATRESTTKSTQATLLEVHKRGMEIVPTSLDAANVQENETSANTNNNNTNNNNNCCNDYWTLTQWWRKERVEDALNDCRTKSKENVSIVATVIALSPIISLDPTHPFALLEVVDTDNTDITSVIVLNGANSLVWHTSVFPFETYTFRNLTCKAWSVPKMLQNEKGTPFHHLVNRVPSRVFVAKESTHVSVYRTVLYPPKIFLAPFHLNTTVQGVIQKVQTAAVATTSSAQRTVIEYIDIAVMSEDSSTSNNAEIDHDMKDGQNDPTQQCCRFARLYLKHFPMSPSLQWSLRSGAVIEASNVHVIMTQCPAELALLHNNSPIDFVYGACLRSTLHLLQCASADTMATAIGFLDTDSSLQKRFWGDATFTQQPISMVYPWKAFAFSKTESSYMHCIYTQHICQWVGQHFPSTQSNIPKTWIVERLVLHSDKSNYNNDTYRHKVPRSPYAEFFDHPLTNPDGNHNQNINPLQCGCTLSVQDRSVSCRTSPFLVSLDDIRHASQTLVVAKIQKRLVSSINAWGNKEPLRSGWQGSVLVEPNELFSRGEEGIKPESEEDLEVFTGGFVSEVHSFLDSTKAASINDDVCDIPIHFLQQENVAIGAFVMGQIKKLAISCLCLGFSSQEENNTSFIKEKKSGVCLAYSLPSFRSNKRNSLLGGCSILSVGGLIFITAIQIICSELHTPLTHQENISCTLVNNYMSLDECLKVSVAFSSQSNITGGYLMRSRLSLRTNADGSYRCCQLTVGSISLDEQEIPRVSNSISQKLNISISSAQSTARVLKLSEKLESICPSGVISNTLKILASSFWAMGDSGRTCALLCGGTEDLCPGSSCYNYYIHVFVPVATMQRSASGFMSSRCFHFDVDSSIHYYNKVEHQRFYMSNEMPVFDFEGRMQSWRGVLNKQLYRRASGTLTNSFLPGELLIKVAPDFPASSLADLFEDLCRHLRRKDEQNLHPSIVRRIVDASLMGISFCCVKYCCSQCSSPLVDRWKSKGNKFLCSKEMNERSFWHLQCPEQFNVPPGPKDLKSHQPEMSTLACPNGCPSVAHCMKWECSGVLDDGTGQATLYADGETALLLLGMSSDTIQCIETGLLSCSEACLTFKRSIPPSQALQKSIEVLLSKQRSLGSCSQNQEHDFLQQLPSALRAEYLMQKHCRSSPCPRRSLEYYVQCKPLPNLVCHLHHTSIEACAVANNAHGSRAYQTPACSYSLPQLKLELVDCGLTSL
ncbi:hypothetical protein IV203_001305 [Nitzschia inconspicua]|uniref:Uncharacterized protein n=1 Tax=Nitzschia inconspicua TaxID=303405 RepID=A0A9K3L7G8_9STRA|nr:hypothetical protein IV203_001305 [Nitzschia inconspicua]